MERTEEEARSELRRVLEVQGLVLARLERLAASLPAGTPRKGPRRRAARLRSAIECLVADSIRPGIEGLRANLEPAAAGPQEAAPPGPVRWSEQRVVDRPWPLNLPVPAEILRLLDLAPFDFAAVHEDAEGRIVLSPYRQWLRELPEPWGEAEVRAILDFLSKDIAFIGPGRVVVPLRLGLAPGERVTLQVVERAGDWRLAVRRSAPAAPAGEETP